MAETPKDNKSKGATPVAPSLKKNKKKKGQSKVVSDTDQERSSNNTTLPPLDEGSNSDEEDEEKNNDPMTLEQKVDDLGGQITNAMELFTLALDAMSQSSSVKANLHKDRYGSKSPTKKEKKRRKEKTNSIAQSVADSAIKRDWREIEKQRQEDYSSDDGSSSSSSSSSDSDSKSSNRGEEDNHSPGKQPSKKKEKKKKHNPSKKKATPSSEEPKESDSGEDSEDSEKDKGGGKKRSGFNSNRLFKSLEATELHAAKTVINVTRQEKECTVRINDFSLSNLCKAMKNIIQFQEREDTRVKMTRVLSDTCKRHLELKYKVTKKDLMDMSLASIFTIMARETKVHSKITFYKAMRQALSHITLMDWNKLNPETHEKFYFEQLALAEEFMMIFRIMLTENKQHCPRIDDKEGGLIKLFKSFHNYDYWKQIWGDMKKRYTTMSDFMDEYQDKAMHSYQLSVAFKELPYKSLTTDKDKDKDREKNYYDKKREISKNLYRSNNSYPHKDKSNHNSFNHIDQDNGYDSEDSYDPTWVNANPEIASGAEEDHGDDSLSEASNEEAEEDDSLKELTLAAFGEHNVISKDKKDLPCLRKLLSGKCEREECPYGHKREVLMKGAADMTAKLKTYTETQGGNTKDNTSAPFKVLQKDKYGKH